MFNLNNVESDKSFNPIKPGEAVPVVLQKVEVTEEGHLDFLFKGTDLTNAGSFKPRFWFNEFDPTSEKYNADNAEVKLKQIKQLMEAFLKDEVIANIKGSTTAELIHNIKMAFVNVADAPAFLKIIYKYNSDTICVIPKYGAFISTEFRPRGLKLRPALDKNNVPYDRVLPMSHYGVSNPTDGAPTFGAEVNDSEDEDIPFGM